MYSAYLIITDSLRPYRTLRAVRALQCFRTVGPYDLIVLRTTSQRHSSLEHLMVDDTRTSTSTEPSKLRILGIRVTDCWKNRWKRGGSSDPSSRNMYEYRYRISAAE